MTRKTSRIPGFYKKTPDERLSFLKEFCNLTDQDFSCLKKRQCINISCADKMIENVVSLMPLPFGIATNFIVNGVDYLVPMVIEEPSVVAASCHAAKLSRSGGGFRVETSAPIMIGQIQLVGISDVDAAKKNIESSRHELLAIANQLDPYLINIGGGATGIEVKNIKTSRGPMLVVHLHVNVKDAMGGNIVNTMVEGIAGYLEKITGGQSRLKIVSNLSFHRMVKASAVWSTKEICADTIEWLLDADALAHADHYRAATHNKGIMNGIDAVALATGNDFRAIEAGAHSFAALGGKYKPLTHYRKDERGNLVGTLEMPLAVGTVGGTIQNHPVARVALKILGIKLASELASVMAAVGLAQNFAALRALVTEGIQKGHMKLHSRKNAI